MITRKELEYVDTWAKKTPYPGNDYSEEALEKLKRAHDLYNKIYNGNKYNIIFSNNEEIDLEIPNSNLAHMLGIDHQNLLDPVFTDFRKRILDLNPDEHISAYRLLTAILENIDKVIEFDSKPSGLRALNYYKISIKSDIFAKLSDLTNFNYGCINFDKVRYMLNSGAERFWPNSTKYLYIPSDEAIFPFFLIGICPDKPRKSSYRNDESINSGFSKPYFVETLFAPEQPEFFFQEQEVTIPTQVLKINEQEMLKFPAEEEKKKKLLGEYENIIRMYGLNNKINIYADYLAMLSEAEKSKKLEKIPY